MTGRPQCGHRGTRTASSGSAGWASRRVSTSRLAGTSKNVETVEQLANPLTVRAPDGSLTTALGLALAPGSPLDGSLLLLRAQPYPRLNDDVPFRLLFTGGFPATIGDADQEASMLVLHYPAEEVQGLRSIDYTPSAELVTLTIEEPGSGLR